MKDNIDRIRQVVEKIKNEGTEQPLNLNNEQSDLDKPECAEEEYIASEILG